MASSDNQPEEEGNVNGTVSVLQYCVLF